MVLPLAFVITITSSLFLYFQKKKLTVLQNSIIFMVLTMVTTNFITIVVLNLKLVKTTENPFLFIVIPLYRDLIVPLLVLIFVNAFFTSSTLLVKSFYILSIFVYLNLIEALFIYFGVLEYIKWNFFFAAIVHFTYLLIGLGLAKIVLIANQKESQA
jgi:hypothetical protein